MRGCNTDAMMAIMAKMARPRYRWHRIRAAGDRECGAGWDGETSAGMASVGCSECAALSEHGADGSPGVSLHRSICTLIAIFGTLLAIVSTLLENSSARTACTASLP